MAVITDEWGFTETLENDSEQYHKFHRDALDVMKKGLDLFGDGKWGGDWKLNAEEKDTGAKVYVRKTDAFGNVYAVSAKINVDPKTLFHVSWDEVSDMKKWNPTVKDFRIITKIGSQTEVVNNSSEALLGGLVSSRDFVCARTWRKINNTLCISGRSIQYEPVPPQKGCVRAESPLSYFRLSPAEGPGPCEIVWMTNIDLKGLLPKSVVERTMNSFLLDYIRYLRKYVEKS